MLFLYYKDESEYIGIDCNKIDNKYYDAYSGIDFNAYLEIKLPWLFAKHRLYFSLSELEKIKKSLLEKYARLSGKCEYRNQAYEKQLEIEFLFHSQTGKINVTGKLCPDYFNKTELSFDLEFDQSYIPFIIKSINDGIEKIESHE